MRPSALQTRDLTAQVVGHGPLGLARRAFGASSQELLVHSLSGLSEMSSSRQGSAIVFGPHSDASTDSVFCCALTSNTRASAKLAEMLGTVAPTAAGWSATRRAALRGARG